MTIGEGPSIDALRRVVLLEDLHDVEIRPSGLFEEWTRLLEQDILQQFMQKGSFVHVACPGCARDDAVPAFSRFGIKYLQCRRCRSLYVSPRPSESSLCAFHQQSAAMSFWYGRFLRETAAGRRERVFQPRAAWIRDLSTVPQVGGPVFADVYARYAAFLEEVADLGMFRRLYVVAPVAGLEDVCRRRGFEIVSDVASIKAKVTTLTMFEVIEQAFDPIQAVQLARALLVDGGMVFLTATSGTGLAVQALGERSPHALPPVHLNLLSVEGFANLLQGQGFEIVELSTPGQLDTEMVFSATRQDPTLNLPPVISEIIGHRSVDTHRAFQRFLQEARLSAHLRAAARKVSGGPE